MTDETKRLTCPKHGTEYAEKEEGVTIGECPWCLQQERDEALSRLGDVLAGYDIERGEKLYRQVEVVRGPGKTVDKIEITKLEAKVEYAKQFGLIIGVAKSSDCPEGKLAGATREGSDLERLERGIADLIEAEAEIERLKGPKMFPLQTSREAKPGPRSIPWEIAEEAYEVYSQKYGRSQSLERLVERGGFGWYEMDMFLPGWRERVDLMNRLKAKIEELVGENEQLRDWRANVTVALREEGGTFYEDVAEKIKSLRAKVEDMKEREKGLETAIELLLQVLPDNDRFKDEDSSWGRAWDELSAEAQLHVKSVRIVAQAIHDRKKIFFQSAVPGLMADLPNANGRIYPLEVVRKAVDDFQTKIEERTALIYVEPENPDRPQLLEAGGVLTQLWVEGGVVYARGHAIQTPAGAKLTSLIQFQHPGIFPAGKGTMKGNEVQDDFQINHFSIGSGHVPGGKIELKLLPEKGEGKKEERDENSD